MRLDFRHYETAITRGLEAFMDTTFLAAVATPIASVAGMVIAYLVVRKAFSGKEALDFMSNLGGAVPGTILGIGYILAFIKAPLILVGLVYVLLAGYLATAGASAHLDATQPRRPGQSVRPWAHRGPAVVRGR